MRQPTGRYDSHLRKVICPKDLDLVAAAVRKGAASGTGKVTWLVIGPLSMVFSAANGGRASNTVVFPTSFSVNHTCRPSGVAAMLGQNGLA